MHPDVQKAKVSISLPRHLDCLKTVACLTLHQR